MAYAPVQGTTGSRNILDRNPVSKNVDFIANNLAPHGSTVRGTYTTPANKLAQVDLITGFIFRKTAASAVDIVTVKIQASIAGRLLTLQFRDNTVGFVIQQAFSKNKLLEPGEQIEIESEDDSTDGRNNYMFNVAITEFDLN